MFISLAQRDKRQVGIGRRGNSQSDKVNMTSREVRPGSFIIILKFEYIYITYLCAIQIANTDSYSSLLHTHTHPHPRCKRQALLMVSQVATQAQFSRSASQTNPFRSPHFPNYIIYYHFLNKENRNLYHMNQMKCKIYIISEFDMKGTCKYLL